MLKETCLSIVVAALLLVSVSYSAPVNPQPNIPDVKEGTDPMDNNFLSLEYKKYLEEVVQLLESDEGFKKELDQMNADGKDDLAAPSLLALEYREYLNQTVFILEEDPEFKKLVANISEEELQTGQIAHYLQFANKQTRTKLDELKRLEVRRLRDLHKKLMKESADEIRAGKRHPQDLPQVDLEHMDHQNPHTFEIEDLKKLIKKTTDDLSNVDKKRKEEFKKYEMNKEHEYREKLKNAKEDEAEKLKKEHEENQKKHKDHPKVHHPANKEQLEEVWEEEDKMDENSFDPKAFFMLHDIDGDGYLNTPEIEALFQKELDKVYNSSNPEDDMVERDEEMNRMREHVFNEIDKDEDGLVSFDEFMQSTKTDDFEKDESWDTLDEEDAFTDDEFDEYEKALAEEEAKLQEKHNLNEPDAAAATGEHPQDPQLNEQPPQPPHPVDNNIVVDPNGAQPEAPAAPDHQPAA